MSVLVYIESDNGTIKKAALEVASYGRALANTLNTSLSAIIFSSENSELLGTYGVDKILTVDFSGKFNAKIYADIITQAAQKEQASVVVLSSSADSRYLAPMLSVGLDAGYVPNVIELPTQTQPFTVKRSVFSNKAFCETEIATEVKIIGLSNNAFGLVEHPVSSQTEPFSPNIISTEINIENVDKAANKVTIADAETVVSAGRGLKGPENWGMVEDLAEVLGAATACSKPVSDLGWRPHSEHVGQTGKPVASNLYIAIGISGAIQHLAGINSSKVKVVINTDPEAPFFKAADYGIVGDAFEVVPKLIEKLKEFKAQNG
jgi:electron transfer flavoprotein alpha subunit